MNPKAPQNPSFRPQKTYRNLSFRCFSPLLAHIWLM